MAQKRTNKTFIVAKNEFLQRVKTRWFVFTTLLGPIVLVGFFGVVGFMSVQALTGGEHTVVFQDETGRLSASLLASPEESITFVRGEAPEDSLRARVLDGTYSGYLRLPAGLIDGEGQASYYSMEGGISEFASDLRRIVRESVRTLRLEDQNVEPEVYEIINAGVSIDMIKLSEEGEEQGSTAAYAVVGGIMGFLIYLTMLIYGSVVMQGVIQEKMNRVVEIVVSSVRPFQLLMGKVLGIGAMGLVQMTFWAVLIAAGTVFSGTVVGLNLGANKDSPDRAADFAEVLRVCGPHLDFEDRLGGSFPHGPGMRGSDGGDAGAGLVELPAAEGEERQPAADRRGGGFSDIKTPLRRRPPKRGQDGEDG